MKIEADKFKAMVGDLGPENIAAIATSGHSNQVCAVNVKVKGKWHYKTSI